MKPYVSCLCVTHKKPIMLNRAINCYYNQTYKNKQLVIIYEESDNPTVEYINKNTFGPDIKLVKINNRGSKLSLGELRNISVNEAEGDYVCQWDDDDWYSCDRLEIQMKYILDKGKSASILIQWIIFDSINKKSYLSFYYPWEGSILCKRAIIQKTPYPPLARGEDTCVIKSLIERDLVVFISDNPELYIYNYHGQNTWDCLHFNSLIESSVELLDDLNEEIQECISIST